MGKVEIIQEGDNGACIFLEVIGSLTNKVVKVFCHLSHTVQ